LAALVVSLTLAWLLACAAAPPPGAVPATAAVAPPQPQVRAGTPPEPYACDVVLRLPGALFAFDQTGPGPQAAALLDEVAARLAVTLEVCPGRRVLVEGHTDWTGPEAYNQMLSEERAEAVRDQLASRGMDPSRLSAVGRGEWRPVATNETAEGRARNRRVEIRLVGDQAGESTVR
jgi:OOP family OmpA-OmpF porin